PDLERIAQRAVEAAQAAGADDAEAWVEEAVTRQIRVYEQNVESLTDAGSRGIGLRVFLDGRSGYAYGTDLSDEGVTALAGEASVALANSRGFRSSYEASSAWAYASVFAGEGADLMTGLGVGLGREPDELDPRAIGDEAAGRALALVGARQPESRRCPVVLDAFVAASFIGFIGGMLSADAVQRGRSLFADREGDEIASAAIRLADDGIDPEGPDSAPFDG